jgi:hypothetical protein
LKESVATGRALTGEEASWDWVQESPNRYWALLPFFSYPPSITDYMAANCSNREMGGDSFEGIKQQRDFRPFTGDKGDPGHLDGEDTFGMCVDTFGAYDAFQKYADLDLCCL